MPSGNQTVDIPEYPVFGDWYQEFGYTGPTEKELIACCLGRLRESRHNEPGYRIVTTSNHAYDVWERDRLHAHMYTGRCWIHGIGVSLAYPKEVDPVPDLYAEERAYLMRLEEDESLRIYISTAWSMKKQNGIDGCVTGRLFYTTDELIREWRRRKGPLAEMTTEEEEVKRQTDELREGLIARADPTRHVAVPFFNDNLYMEIYGELVPRIMWRVMFPSEFRAGFLSPPPRPREIVDGFAWPKRKDAENYAKQCNGGRREGMGQWYNMP
jgi:hypothetical protein